MDTSLFLDSPKTYAKYDSLGMRTHLDNIVSMAKDAWENNKKFDLPEKYKNADSIVVMGMGGSAISGNLIEGLVRDKCKRPISVFRQYNLPAFVNENTLVIFSSYSGNTEETVSALYQGLKSPCMKLVFTSGGKLLEIAKENKIPFIENKYKSPPRAAVPHSMFALLRVLSNLGYIECTDEEVKGILEESEKYRKTVEATVPTRDNPAKQLAIKLKDRAIMVYGAEHMFYPAMRLKSQINENSKNWAFCAEIPEVDHIDVQEYPHPEAFKKILSVIMLKSDLNNPRIQKRFDITETILGNEKIDTHVIDFNGGSKLMQLMRSMIFGDYLSFYIAETNHEEPILNEIINYVKSEMGDY